MWCGSVLLDAYHDPDYGEGCLFLPGRSELVEIVMDYKKNGYGGSQPFFLCPACGERRRFIYWMGVTFLCRKCAQLNYRSSQETRSDSMFFYGKGVKYAKEHFDISPGDISSGLNFCGWIPPRRRYQHGTTYQKHLYRLMKYEDQHFEREMEDMARILKIFK